eukprot:TRINITY_DN42960_c0_g1_i6.p4 TRINITY_DN42960_c0_g1~~TRINITY_DN42960_c0_g1_i6.p4  ORF type:complete len:112 (-),score=6.63 TRINITY_DN42960_c0_g1_i6:39-374(-)
MFAVRWLLEDACSTLLVFPLSCAAGIKSAALMDAVTMNVVPSSWRGPLSVVVGGLVCLATGVVLSLPGRLLIEEDDVSVALTGCRSPTESKCDMKGWLRSNRVQESDREQV